MSNIYSFIVEYLLIKTIDMKNIYLVVLLLYSSVFTYGQWGSLDPTFGDAGKVIMNIGEGFENAADILQQEDGKLIVIGSGTDGNTKIMVSRFNSDGTIDNTFGSEGKTLVAVSPNINYGINGAFQSDGKIVVGARCGDGFYNDFTCIRLTNSGILDSSFGVDGIFIISLADKPEELTDIKVLDDDYIILAGYAGNTDVNEDFALVKLTPDGLLDTSFGVNGIVLHDVTGKFDRIKAIAIKSDGKILGVGSVYDEVRIGISALVQFQANGLIDNTFGDGGLITATPGPYASVFNGVVINEDNTIVVAGSLDYDSQYDFLAAKFNEDGTVFSQFGEDGFFIQDYNGNSEYAATMVKQPDGKFILGGSQGIWPESDFAIVRISNNGELDESFGNDGLITTDFFNGFDYAVGLTLQADGKLVAGGSASDGSDYQLALARYTTGISVGVENIEGKSKYVNVFPNPAKQNINIQFELVQDGTVEMEFYNVSGKKVKELRLKNMNKGQQSIAVDLSDLHSGLHVVQIKTADAYNIVKLLKM